MFAILCYHKIGPEAQEGRYLNTPPEKLSQQIAFLKRRGLPFYRADELIEPLGLQAGLGPRKGVCLTFDDAYQSFVDNGLPVLQSQAVPASVYAVTGLVGQKSSWDGEKARPLADWDALTQLAAAGIEVGNHSVSHADFSTLNMEEQRAEILKAREELIARGFEHGSFCLPYGRFGAETIELVKECGYPVCLTLEKGLADKALANRLPRITMSFSDGVPGLIYKLYLKPRLEKFSR